MNRLIVLAPAKLNITLDITGKIFGGYHTMDMIMQTVTIFDEVVIEKAEDIQLKSDAVWLPCSEANTAYKAAIVFLREVGLLAGAHIQINKKIPTKAGMAGGSADAAAVLVGLNELYKTGFSKEELAEMGFQIGADVPFSVIGGTARATGVGEVVMPLPALPSCYFVICMPPYGIRTAEAFARYDVVGTHSRPNNEAAEKAIFAQNLAGLCANMGNALQQAANGAQTEKICNILRNNNALAAQLTGSGAAVFGVFDELQKAKVAKEALQKEYKECFLVKPCRTGAYISCS